MGGPPQSDVQHALSLSVVRRYGNVIAGNIAGNIADLQRYRANPP